MATSYEFLIVQAQNRIIGVQEIRVEDNLHSIIVSIEKLHAANLVQDRIIAIVEHVVCCNSRKRVALKSENTALE